MLINCAQVMQVKFDDIENSSIFRVGKLTNLNENKDLSLLNFQLWKTKFLFLRIVTN